mgnify:CR=1 FL=1
MVGRPVNNDINRRIKRGVVCRGIQKDCEGAGNRGELGIVVQVGYVTGVVRAGVVC